VAAPSADAHTEADREFHEATAHLYDPALLPIFGAYYDVAIGPLLDDLASRAPGRRALDVGCGTGGITVELARRGFDVTGIDHSPAMMEVARRKVEALPGDVKVDFRSGDVRDLPFEDASFDLLTCQGVLHHLTDVAEAVREFARVLAPSGVFYLSEPCLGSNLLLRAWQRGPARLRRQPEVGADLSPEVLEHEEGPIDQDSLLRDARDAGLEPTAEYWSEYPGLERLPRRLHGLALRALTKPWRRRSGNMVYVTGVRPGTQSA
jgi:SAM-dependent methyltransferase